MSSRMLLGVGSRIMAVPFLQLFWQKAISRTARKIETRLRRFMTEDDHSVRDFIVRELPRIRTPLSPELIAEGTGVPVDRVGTILDKLQKRLIFLVRNEDGAVTWAYPVTIEDTPHSAVFGRGERINLA